MKKRLLILALTVLWAVPGESGLRFGLGNAVAHRSADLINRAGPCVGQGCPAHSTGITGPVTFTAAPIDLTHVTFLQSLGNLNPPGHTFPTDHIYFYYTNLGFTKTANPITTANPGACGSGCPVYAPADGFISFILTGADYGTVANQIKITIVNTDTFSSYFDHLSSLAPSILAQTGPLPSFASMNTWVPVKAGQVIGAAGGVAGENALDLGVINTQISQPFITPSHYGQSSNSDSPYKYFAEPLRSTLYAMVGRTTPDYLGSNEMDGIFCFDVPNTISGNWAAQGSDSQWLNPDTWTQELSIAYDAVYASQIRITFGGKFGSQTFGLVGSWMVQSGALPPASVTAATGAYGYQIYGWDPSFGTIDLNSGPGGATGPNGLLMLQLIDNNTLKAEYFPGAAIGVTTLPFDSNAVIYIR